MNSNSTMIRKLKQAINSKGYKITYHTSEFYSDKQKRTVTCYQIKYGVTDEVTGRCRNYELFKTYSQIQVVLYLRDFWYHINGMEIPTDNEIWNDIKSKNDISFDGIEKLEI